MKINKLFNFVLIFSWVPAFAQTSPELEFKRALAEFPGEHAVVTKRIEKTSIELEDNQFKILQDSYTETLYLDNLAGLFAEHSIDYTTFDKVVEIEAATLVPKNRKYKEEKVKDFTYTDKLSQSVFYDGGQSVSFIYPGLQPGYKSYVKVKQEITEPRFLPGFFFQKGIPVKEQEFIITAPNTVELGWKLFNVADSLVTFSENRDKNATTYTWKLNKIDKLKSEASAPNPRYYSPHVITWIKSYTVDGEKKSLLNGTPDLYSWYYSLVKNSNKDESDELKRIADSLKTGADNNLEIVKRTFYWVQDNIKYIAVEDGMGGFVPRSGKTVCEKRYGDCKDMASIIYKILEYSGIQSHLTWIGSRDIPYNYSDISTPSVDNHMICTYIEDGKYYFLDATGQYTPFGMPTGFIQGKEALIGIGNNKFEVVKVPVLPASESKLVDSVEIRLEGDKVSGTGKTRVSGYDKINLTYKLSSIDKDYQKYFRSYFDKGNNKFLLDKVKVENLYDRDKDILVSYDFNIQDYIKSFQNEVYVNLNLSKDLSTSEIKDDRNYSKEFDNKWESVYNVSLTIPDGYKVTYIPENVSFDSKDFGFDISYKKAGDKVILTNKIYINILLLEKENFDTWNEMIKELNKAYSEVVVLKKI